MAPTSQSTSNNIVHLPYDIKINVDKAFSEYVLENLRKHSDKIAQINSDTGETETFGELLNRSIALAQALKTKGITADDIVGLCCHNIMDYIVVMIASIFIGARFCSADISAIPSSIVHCLKLTAPTIIFCEQESEDLMESTIKEAGIKCEIITFDKTDKHISMENFVKKFKSNEEFKIDTSKTLKDSNAIAFTSGTSGLSKGAILSNFGLYYSPLVNIASRPDIKTVTCLTLPYWAGNIFYCMLSIFGGITRVLYKLVDIKTVIKVIQDYKVNNTIFSQHLINDLINNPEVCQYDTSSFRYIYCAGSLMGRNLIAKATKLLPHTQFLNGFGMTEMCGFIFNPNLLIDAEGNYCVGSPYPGAQYKVTDTNTEENLGPQKRGELRIKYDGMLHGYLHQPDATAESLDKDGFFKTGDIAYYDDNYNFFVVDRLKEVFKYRQHHISPVIIEDALVLHPDVKDCAIIPVPHEHDANHIMALIKLGENAKVTEQGIIQYIAEHLTDPYHLRGGVKFVNSIPRNSTGKIRRIYLRDQILKHR